MPYQYFTRAEFACKCGCNTNEIKSTFVYRLDELRHRCGFPFKVNSGYRCESHPAEAVKDKPGQHHEGLAADIQVNNGHERYLIQKHAYAMGFSGIGPAKDFVHIDDRGSLGVSWVY